MECEQKEHLTRVLKPKKAKKKKWEQKPNNY